MKPVAVAAATWSAPGGLRFEDMLAGRSAVLRLPEEMPVAVGAPALEPLAEPLSGDSPPPPRGVLLATRCARALARDPERRYGLVLALSSLETEPGYLERALAGRHQPPAMAALQAYCDHEPLLRLAADLDIGGPLARVESACASGSDALILATRWIDCGLVDDVVVVAASALLNPAGLALFRNLHALSERDDLEASRPFDRRRDGFVMGEGAAAVWLSAAPGAPPLGWIRGYGQSLNADKFTDMPEDLSPMLGACRQALDGQPVPGYISAHGTSTPINDRRETALYKELFGDAAYRIPISSLKSMTGHCLGASSLIEAIVCLRAMTEETVPPTVHLREPDPECDLDYVAEGPRSVPVEVAMSCAFAFGGHNSILVLGREAR